MQKTIGIPTPYDFQGSPFEIKDCPVCGKTADIFINDDGLSYKCPECGLTSPRGHDPMLAMQNWHALSIAIRGKSHGWGALSELYKDRVIARQKENK